MNRLTLIKYEEEGSFYNVFINGKYVGVTMYSGIDGWSFTGSGGKVEYLCTPYKRVRGLKYMAGRIYYELFNI